MNVNDIVKQYREGKFKVTEEETIIIEDNIRKYENIDSYEALKRAITAILIIRYNKKVTPLNKNTNKSKETLFVSKETISILQNTYCEYPRISINREGNSFLTTTKNNTIILADIKTGKIKKQFIGHKDYILMVTFDYNENNIISISQNNTIKKWSVEKNNIIDEFTGDYGFLNHFDIAISSDKKYLLSAATGTYEPEPVLKLIDLDNGNIIKRFIGHLEDITALCFSWDNKKVFSSDRSNIKIWDIETGLEQVAIKNTICDNSIMANKKGNLILCGSHDCYFMIYDVKEKKGNLIFDKHEDSVCTATFNSDDSLILSGSADSNIILWDVKKSRALGIFKGHSADVVAVEFIQNTQMFISSSLDNTTRVWDYSKALSTVSKNTINIFKGHKDAARSAIFAYNDKKIISSSDDCSIILWDNNTKKKEKVLKGHTKQVNNIDLDENSNLLVSCSSDENIILWDMNTFEKKYILKGHTEGVWCVKFCQHNLIISSSDDMSIILWDKNTGEKICQLLGHEGEIPFFCLSADDRTIISASFDNTIRIWDLRNRILKKTLKGHEASLWTVAVDANSQYIISGGEDRLIKLWSFISYEEIHSYEKNPDTVCCIEIAPNDKYFAAGYYNGLISLWDIKNHNLIKTLSGHDDEPVSSLRFSKDGEYLLSSSWDGNVILWKL
jgi:WD40 repeat protein